MEKSKAHFAVLDQLRGYAIALVFLYHVACDAFGKTLEGWSGWLKTSEPPVLFPLNLGWCGVAIFFVVSGFCIQASVRKEASIDWRRFFVRRALRIYPPYFVALVLFVWAFPLVGLWPWSDGKSIVSHFFLAHNFVKGTFLTINPSFWSIAIEWQLYLLFPLICFSVARFGWGKTMAGVALIEVTIRCLQGLALVLDYAAIARILAGVTFLYWFSWSLGAWVATRVYVPEGNCKILTFLCRNWLLWLGLAIGSNYIKPLYPFAFLFFALFTAAFIARSFISKKPDPKRNNLLGLIATNLGLISFSFYLLHQPLIGMIGNWFRRIPEIGEDRMLTAAMVLIVSLPVSLGFATLFYWVVEKPSHEAGRALGRIWSRRSV